MCSSSSDDDTSEDEVPSLHSMLQVQYPTPDTSSSTSKCTLATYEHLDNKADEEEDFQTIPLDDEHCTTEEIHDRPLGIHEHSLPHGLCQYPCPCVDYQTPPYFETMDLSDISKFDDLMTTSSDEDIPTLEDGIH